MAQPPWDAVIEGVVVDFSGNPKGSGFRIKWQTIGPETPAEVIQPGMAGTISSSSSDDILTDEDGRFRIVIPRYLYLSHPYLFTAFTDNKVIGQVIVDIPVGGVNGSEVYRILLVEGALIEFKKGQLKPLNPDSWWYESYDEKYEGQQVMLLLQEIRDTIRGRLEYDAVKEKAIDKINDELKFYRDGFVFQSQKAIFIDLMLLYDSLERILSSAITEAVLTRERIVEHLEIFKEELLEILYRRDITPFDDHPEFLDYKLHKTVKTIPTDAETENNKVDKIIKIGFRLNDKILRPEEVIIKKYMKPKEDTNDTKI